MDCNKEEAFRAKALAEIKMRNNDFVEAQKLVMKAQRLFSCLESLPQMLAVCDVHISAESKINGLENWYGILQVKHFSDDVTVKKQYRKLALLLHPDKNQFAGAEAAFKLVWEASRLLSDKEKRSQYDIKHRIYSRFAGKQFANSGQQCAAAKNASNSIINNVTFWTCCEHCGYRYKYMKEYVNTLLYCSNCRRSYKAYDTGAAGVMPKSSTGQKDVRNQGLCNTSLHKNVESTGAQSGNTAVDVDKKETVKGKINQKNEVGEIKNVGVRKSKIKDESTKNYAEISKPEKGEEKMKNNSEPSKTDILKAHLEIADPETCASKSVPDVSVSRNDQAPYVRKEKNKRKVVEEPIECNNVDVSDNFETKAYSKDNNKRKSPRKRQQKSYQEEGSSDHSIIAPRKRSRSSVGLKSERTTKKKNSGVGSSKHLDTGGTSASSCVYKGKAKKKVESASSCVYKGKAKKKVESSGYLEVSSTKDKGIGKCEANGEGVVIAGKIENNQKANKNPIAQHLPDPEFNNFELMTSCFSVNQVWSLYDSYDGMPRFYARIDKVLDSEFKLWITWIDPLQDNKDNTIPVACGIFQDGVSEEVDDHLIFSCKMLHLFCNNNITIYPRIGEVWAVFRNWDFSWNASLENHKRPYEYDYVEVLSDFKEEVGLGVAYLGKVEGFVSLFSQDAQQGVLQLQIPASEMLRFSHKVQSFKMTGKEREDVPPGCWELDTAALPKDMFEVDDSKVDVGLDREEPNGKTGGSFPEASKVEVQENTTLKSSPSPKKRQNAHDNRCSVSEAFDGRCADHEMKSVKKSRKSTKVVDVLKLRKSPRILSATNSQVTSVSSQKTADKKSANNGESCGQPDESCISGEKITTTESSRISKTLWDTQKPIGNSNKRWRNNESLSQSKGNDFLTQLNGAIESSDPGTHVPCRTRQENIFNFENQRSWDKFQVDQTWAIYSNDKGIPGKYAQIKKIDTVPEFKLHVAPLMPYHPQELITHPVCCGRFKLKTGKAEVLVPSNFSHQVKAVKGKKNRIEVYPEKGEIWALYKKWNTRDCAESEEVEIIEIVETDEQRIQGVLLTSAKGFNKPFYERSEESKTRFVVNIARTEVSRFSHQIPAYRYLSGESECWELDPKAVFDFNSKSP